VESLRATLGRDDQAEQYGTHADRQIWRAWETGLVADIVDPTPAIEERLRLLAAKYEPKLDALERAVADSDVTGKRSAKADLRAAKREYAAVRRNVEKLRGPSAKW
jgi:hypothetical protein